MNDLLKLTEKIGYEPTFYFLQEGYCEEYYDASTGDCEEYYSEDEFVVKETKIEKNIVKFLELCLLQKFIEEKYYDLWIVINKDCNNYDVFNIKYNNEDIIIICNSDKTELLKEGLKQTVEYIINNEIK